MRARCRRWSYRLLLALALGVVAIVSGTADAAQRCGTGSFTRTYPTPAAGYKNIFCVGGFQAGDVCSYGGPFDSSSAACDAYAASVGKSHAGYRTNNIPPYTEFCEPATGQNATTGHCSGGGQEFGVQYKQVIAPVDQCTDHPEGTKKRFGGTGAVQPSICFGECRFELDQTRAAPICNNGVCVGQVMAVAVSGGTEDHFDGNYVSSGDYCDNASDPEPPINADENSELCTTVQGVQVCTGGSTPKHCIKILGQLSCFSDAGDVCTDQDDCPAVVDVLKNPDGSATGRADAPTPTAPNTGTAGQRAPHGLELDIKLPSGDQGNVHGGGSHSFHWWTPAAVDASNTADGSVGGTDGGEGECDPATEECEGEEPGEECDPAIQDCSFNPPGKGYAFADTASEVAAAKQARSDAFGVIRSEAAGIFGGVIGGTGSLPSFQIPNPITGAAVTVSLQQFADEIEILPVMLLLISFVAAAVIIMGGRE